MFFKKTNESPESSGLVDISDDKVKKAYLTGIAIGIGIGIGLQMAISGLLH
ncbi:MAG TPA: hypothetical protein VK950_00395 [Methylophilus sp.]|jgi:hypothetical protein|uniref:hypothetical protein n=1 Tax=Methylophilus sp. TaxID=29541 RepID=UPI002BBFEE92|nr:hypothetical protein [Methylophilus sp.]HSH87946.1 hypothetical protein [Methylophilus sp.]HSI44607.1 hypothetical protein [Methylophilus sp.]